jgi:CSLREA domain-containing protein
VLLRAGVAGVLAVLAALLGSGGGPSTYAALFVVDSLGDAGDASPGDGVCATGGAVCTLRAAIEETNALSGPDMITFSIPDPGTPLNLIAPGSQLPQITESVIIDASTDPDGIGLLGSSAPLAGAALAVIGDNVTIKDLTIVSFAYEGIVLAGDNNTVRGTKIGTDGTLDYGMGNSGIYIQGANNTIESNVISGNWVGVVIGGTTASGNIVRSNFIGSNATGSSAIPNDNDGVYIWNGAHDNQIGAPKFATGSAETYDLDGNFIAFNGVNGVRVESTAGGQPHPAERGDGYRRRPRRSDRRVLWPAVRRHEHEPAALRSAGGPSR